MLLFVDCSELSWRVVPFLPILHSNVRNCISSKFPGCSLLTSRSSANLSSPDSYTEGVLRTHSSAKGLVVALAHLKCFLSHATWGFSAGQEVCSFLTLLHPAAMALTPRETDWSLTAKLSTKGETVHPVPDSLPSPPLSQLLRYYS